MANPQCEDGHTRIANEIIEALARIRISGEEMQILWVIIRQTYGWQKKEDMISLSRIASMTGLKVSNVCRAMKKLLSKMIILKNDSTYITTYSFQKHYEKWKPLSKKSTLNIDTLKNDSTPLSKMIEKPLSKMIEKPLSKMIDTKERKEKKENNTKETISAKAEKCKKFVSDYPRGYTDKNNQFCPYYCKDTSIKNSFMHKKESEIDEIMNHYPVYLANSGTIVNPIKYLQCWKEIPLDKMKTKKTVTAGEPETIDIKDMSQEDRDIIMKKIEEQNAKTNNQ